MSDATNYASNGYVSKGNTACCRSVIAQEALENWVLDQIAEIVQRYCHEGGEETLRDMIRQELGATQNERLTSSSQAREILAARKAEITRIVNNALSTLTDTNRSFLQAHLENLRLEMKTWNGRKTNSTGRRCGAWRWIPRWSHSTR